MPGEGRLPHALPRADDRDRRERERIEPRWVEAEVGARIRHAATEHAADEGQALDRAEDGLVGEVDDDLGR